MLAFLNDHKVKEKYLTRVIMHRKADEIIKGKYWVDGKGCAVGCTIHSGKHADYETELGIPRILARLEDGIFEALPNDLAKTWPERFLSSVNVGANLEMVWPKFAVWLLGDSEHGVIKYAKNDKYKAAIQKIIDMYAEKINGKEISANEWLEARRAAAAYAAAYAAYAAAYAAYAAAYAADAAAYADAYAADAAAYADAADAAAYAAAYAAYAADDADGKSKARIKQSEKLLELLREAK